MSLSPGVRVTSAIVVMLVIAMGVPVTSSAASPVTMIAQSALTYPAMPLKGVNQYRSAVESIPLLMKLAAHNEYQLPSKNFRWATGPPAPVSGARHEAKGYVISRVDGGAVWRSARPAFETEM